MVEIYYDSLTGNCKRFADKLGGGYDVKSGRIPHSPFLLITHTIGFGQAPTSTLAFMDKCHHLCVGVCSSGNRNWNQNFGRAAEIVKAKYRKPIILKFELQGTDEDVNYVKGEIAKYEKMD